MMISTKRALRFAGVMLDMGTSTEAADGTA